MTLLLLEADVDGSRIVVNITGEWKWIEQAKDRLKARASGVRWRKATKDWSMPLTVDNYDALCLAFPRSLTASGALAAWATEGTKARAAQAALAAASDADLHNLPRVAPVLYAALRPDQRAGAAWVANAYRGGGLVADAPGSGKTVETIAGMLEWGGTGPILVVCPRLSVRSVWYKEFQKWCPQMPVYMARGTRAKRERAITSFLDDPAETKVLIGVAEMLQVRRKATEATDPKSAVKKRGRVEGYSYPELFQIPWRQVICDESHRLLGSLSVAKSNLAGEGLTQLNVRSDGRRYALSGTPFGKGGRVQGMFGTLHWLWPDEYTSFWRWAEKHFNVEEEDIYIPGMRGQTRKTMKIAGLREGKDGEEFLRSLGPRILRRTKDETLPWLPAKQYVYVGCELEGAQLKQYKQLMDDAEVVVSGGIVAANGVLAELTRAKQIANGTLCKTSDGRVGFAGESCKVDQLMQLLEQRGITTGDGDMKVIVASQFNAFLEGAVLPALTSAGVEFLYMTGKTSDNSRDDLMQKFQGEGGPRVFVINSKAGGISVTLDAADEVHILDEMDNPEENEQLEDRAHRASRNHQVTIYYYRSEGTIDTNILGSVEGKRTQQHIVLDGRRGVEYVRNVIKYTQPEGT